MKFRSPWYYTLADEVWCQEVDSYDVARARSKGFDYDRCPYFEEFYKGTCRHGIGAKCTHSTVIEEVTREFLLMKKLEDL